MPVIVRLAEPSTVADDCLLLANRTPPWQEGQWDPRFAVVFRLRQCDIKNHGWREGPAATVHCPSFDLLAGPSPSARVNFKRKKNTAFRFR